MKPKYLCGLGIQTLVVGISMNSWNGSTVHSEELNTEIALKLHKQGTGSTNS